MKNPTIQKELFGNKENIDKYEQILKENFESGFRMNSIIEDRKFKRNIRKSLAKNY